jgi:hypothetical protein
MTAPLLDLVRTLSSFAPAQVDLRRAPWEDFVDWSIANGLAPLAAYNLEYRLTSAGAPEWARDRLLSVYQGSVNDNVMKLVSFKRAVDDLEGRRLLLLGGASFAEVLYPHVAFRPLSEVRLQLPAADLEPFTGYLRQHRFKPLEGDLTEAEAEMGAAGVVRALTDDHVILLLATSLLDSRRGAEEQALWDRALPVKVYGKSVFRPQLEDAILLCCLEHARAGYQVPLISFVDLRELLLGAPHLSSAYSHPPDLAQLKARASRWRIDRALYASLSIVARLYPETAERVGQALPELRGATRALLDRVVVEPLASLQGMRRVRGMERLRRLLSGG